jgi:hypothetical protein
MLYFCTYFDSNYLVKGLALYRSLRRQDAPFRLWVLCFDDIAYKALQTLALPEVYPIALREFEAGDEELLQVKGNRSRIEYYFTCTPSLPLYILRNWPEVDVITYIDSDLYFFHSPLPVYAELGDNSVLLVGHRYPENRGHLYRYGVYNVGIICFRRDDSGIRSLQWWRQRCIEWCYDRVEDGRFADQKYLDDWPTRFHGVVVLEHKGAGLAPWNVESHRLSLREGHVYVDSYPLLFFHFHGLQQRGRWLCDPNLGRYGVHVDGVLKRHIYGPYIKELREVGHWVSVPLRVHRSHLQMGSVRGKDPGNAAGSGPLRLVMRTVRYRLHLAREILQGRVWVTIAGRTI